MQLLGALDPVRLVRRVTGLVGTQARGQPPLLLAEFRQLDLDVLLLVHDAPSTKYHPRLPGAGGTNPTYGMEFLIGPGIH